MTNWGTDTDTNVYFWVVIYGVSTALAAEAFDSKQWNGDNFEPVSERLDVLVDVEGASRLLLHNHR